MGETESVTTACTVYGCTNTTYYKPKSADPINTDAGLIALAAALSIVIPVICVFILRFRRAKKEELARRRAQANGEIRSQLSPGVDPPPSYEQVQGLSPNSAQPTSASLEVFLVENEITHRVGGSENRSAGIHEDDEHVSNVGRSDDDNRQIGISESDQNPGYSSESVSAVSVPEPHATADLNGSTTEREGPPSRLFSHRITQRWNNNTNTLSSTFHTSLSSSSPPQTSSESQPTSQPQSFWSRFAKRRPSNGSSSQGNPHIQGTQTRFLGMHISLQDFYNHDISMEEDDSVPPPPSYDEALKILEANKHMTAPDNISVTDR